MCTPLGKIGARYCCRTVCEPNFYYDPASESCDFPCIPCPIGQRKDGINNATSCYKDTDNILSFPVTSSLSPAQSGAVLPSRGCIAAKGEFFNTTSQSCSVCPSGQVYGKNGVCTSCLSEKTVDDVTYWSDTALGPDFVDASLDASYGWVAVNGSESPYLEIRFNRKVNMTKLLVTGAQLGEMGATSFVVKYVNSLPIFDYMDFPYTAYNNDTFSWGFTVGGDRCATSDCRFAATYEATALRVYPTLWKQGSIPTLNAPGLRIAVQSCESSDT